MSIEEQAELLITVLILTSVVFSTRFGFLDVLSKFASCFASMSTCWAFVVLLVCMLFLSMSKQEVVG